jgi:hydroxyacylglutathione hydrolase
MKALNVTTIEAFDDNYIWLIHANVSPESSYKNDIIIVDPGDKDPVLKAIRTHHYNPKAIFITHHHGDHCGGVQALVEHYDIPVYGPAKENIPELTHSCKQEDIIDFEEMKLSFKVMDVPGHTRGHIAFLSQIESRQACLFIGDTLFAGGCGKLFEGTFEQMQHSLSLLLDLDNDTLVYCAHEYTQDNLKFAIIVEPENQALIKRIEDTHKLRKNNQPSVPSLLQLEKQTNPFLRFNQPSLIRSAEKYAGHKLSNAVEVFKTVRLWKDALDA